MPVVISQEDEGVFRGWKEEGKEEEEKEEEEDEEDDDEGVFVGGGLDPALWLEGALTTFLVMILVALVALAEVEVLLLAVVVVTEMDGAGFLRKEESIELLTGAFDLEDLDDDDGVVVGTEADGEAPSPLDVFGRWGTRVVADAVAVVAVTKEGAVILTFLPKVVLIPSVPPPTDVIGVDVVDDEATAPPAAERDEEGLPLLLSALGEDEGDRTEAEGGRMVVSHPARSLMVMCSLLTSSLKPEKAMRSLGSTSLARARVRGSMGRPFSPFSPPLLLFAAEAEAAELLRRDARASRVVRMSATAVLSIIH